MLQDTYQIINTSASNNPARSNLYFNCTYNESRTSYDLSGLTHTGR